MNGEDKNRNVKEQAASEPREEALALEPEAEEPQSLGSWFQSLKRRQALDGIRPQRKSTQDRVKPLLLGVLGVVVVVVVLLGMFSTPIRIKKESQARDRRTPNLGRPQGTDSGVSDPDKATRSVTPLIRAEVHAERDATRDLVTERDLQSSPSKPGGADNTSTLAPAKPPSPPKPPAHHVTLGQ